MHISRLGVGCDICAHTSRCRRCARDSSSLWANPSSTTRSQATGRRTDLSTEPRRTVCSCSPAHARLMLSEHHEQSAAELRSGSICFV